MFVNARKILPVVTLNSENLIDGTGTFFIDSGSEISLIKKSALRYSEYVNTRVQVKILGIIQKEELTKGSVILQLNNLPCLFHVIDDRFLCEADALLGLDNLKRYKGKIDLDRMRLHFGDFILPILQKEKFSIQPNSSQNIYFCVKDITEEFIPQLDPDPHLITGNALAESINGQAYGGCPNISNEVIELEAPIEDL